MIEKEIIKSKYGNIAAYKKGAGPKTILLLHGAGCDSTMLSWREVFKALSDEFTVYAFDFLGYGRSDKADELVGDQFFDTHIILLWPGCRWAERLLLDLHCVIRTW